MMISKLKKLSYSEVDTEEEASCLDKVQESSNFLGCLFMLRHFIVECPVLVNLWPQYHIINHPDVQAVYQPGSTVHH